MRGANYIKDMMTYARATDFLYNHGSRHFSVGKRQVTIQHATENYRHLYPQEGDPIAHDGSVLVSPVTAKPVMYPRMYDWLNNNLDSSLCSETVDVMIDVFSDLRPDLERKHLQPDTGLFGFSVNRLRTEHPHINLTVLGHCACMGVSVSGMIGQNEWDTKFASFEMHNIDTPEQRVSVLAGLGHVAFRAMNGPSTH